MKDERLPWFPCDAGKLLGALAGMPPDEQLVYVVVLLRIYEGAGPCRDTIDALARRTGFNKRRVLEALDRLFKSGRLTREGADGIMNPKAAEIIASRRRTRDELSQAGTEGANRRWKKDKPNQTPTHAQARPTPSPKNGDLQLDLESTPPNGGEPAPKPKREKPRTKISPDWQLTSADAAFAGERGFHGQTARGMAERFKNRHQAQGTLSADWAASWRTWVLNEIRFSAERQSRSPPARGPSLTDIAMGRTDGH